MKSIDYTGRWLKTKEGNYLQITEYDTNGYVKTSDGHGWDLHYINQPFSFKKHRGEELMPEDWFKEINYEIY